MVPWSDDHPGLPSRSVICCRLILLGCDVSEDYSSLFSKLWGCWVTRLKALRPQQNGRYLANEISKCIFLNENFVFWFGWMLFHLIISQCWFRLDTPNKWQAIILTDAYTVQCRFKVVNLLPNLHNRHPIAHPWGGGMGSLLWFQYLIHFLILLSQCCM